MLFTKKIFKDYKEIDENQNEERKCLKSLKTNKPMNILINK